MALLLVIFAFLAICGFVIARYGFRIREMLLLLPVALGIGITLHFFLLNIALRLIPVLPAAWGVLLVMGLGASLAWWRGQPAVEPLRLGCSRRTALALLILWLAVTASLYHVRRVYGDVDEVDHGPRATILGRVGLPLTGGPALRAYSEPNLCDQYHYAEDAAAGVLSRQTGLDWREVSHVRVAYEGASVIGLCFVFLWQLLGKKSIPWALLGCLLFLTTGPATWLAELHNIPALDQLAGDSPLFARTRDYSPIIEVKPFERYAYLFHPHNLMVPFSFYLSAANPWGFWMVGLLTWLAWFGSNLRYGYQAAGLAVLGAFSALYFTSGVILIVGPIGLYLLWQALFQRQWKTFLIFCGVALLTLILQGGLITSYVFCQYSADNYFKQNAFWDVLQNQAQPNVYFEPATNPPPIRPLSYQDSTASDYVYLLNPLDWLSVLVDWGFGLPLFWGVLIYFIWQIKHPKLTAILLASAISLCIPFLITLFLAPNDMNRLAVLPIWIASMLSVLIWERFWKQGWLYQGAIIFIVLSLTFTGLYNFFPSLRRPPIYARYLSTLDFEVQAEWQNRLDPLEERVWDPSYHPTYQHAVGSARTIQIFGTFSSRENLPGINELEDPATQAWMFTGLAGDLRVSGYDYLYVDGIWLTSPLSFLYPVYLDDPTQYELIQTWDNGVEQKRLYHAIGQEQSIPDDILDHEPFMGLSEAHFQDFLNYTPSFWETQPELIFNPALGELQYNPNKVAVVIGSWYESGRFEQASAFDLMAAVLSSRYEEDLDLDEDQTQILADWKATRDAKLLNTLGIHYVLVDAFWQGWSTEEQYNRLMASEDYRLLGTWTLPIWGREMPYYYLLKVKD